MTKTFKKIVYAIGAFILFSIFVVVAVGAVGVYANRAAEKRAKDFCDAVEVGSAISDVVARAKDRGIRYGSDKWYTFYFPGAVFDKAVCEVSADTTGRVVSRGSRMEYD